MTFHPRRPKRKKGHAWGAGATEKEYQSATEAPLLESGRYVAGAVPSVCGRAASARATAP